MDKIYIFDLDHTLIDARKMKEDLGLLLTNNKDMISEEIWNYYNENDVRIINFLEKELKKYIFDNVLENLNKIRETKILLTYGDLNYQRKKVMSLGFDKIFDRVILTDKNKVEFLKDFYEKNNNKKIYFINDNYNKRFSENKEIKEKIPKINIFEVDNYISEKEKTINNIFKKILN